MEELATFFAMFSTLLNKYHYSIYHHKNDPKFEVYRANTEVPLKHTTNTKLVLD